MGITDELRSWAARRLAGWKMAREEHDEVAAIADRIDEEYKKALSGAYADKMDASGWVRLPKDADGEYIHIGDLMAYADNTKPMEVVALVPPAVFLTEDGPRYADMCRHYHAPTVEDVLREFAEKITDSQIPGMHSTYEEAIAEYAANLRLADDKKEQ